MEFRCSRLCSVKKRKNKVFLKNISPQPHSQTAFERERKEKKSKKWSVCHVVVFLSLSLCPLLFPYFDHPKR